MTGADDREGLEALLREHGLFVRGLTRLDESEFADFGLDPGKPELALVGNIGSSYWQEFSRSPEFGDGAADPLDRWSRRVASAVAEELALAPLYPFEGPPYYPFQQWARRAEALEQSPVGVMMHPEYGLWHSYRFALQGQPTSRTSFPRQSSSGGLFKRRRTFACFRESCWMTVSLVSRSTE